MGRPAPHRRPRAARTLLTIGLSLASGTGCLAAEGPILWGYGVKGCRDLVAAAPTGGMDTVNPEGARYREWLAGLVTGLNLATGMDVLKGAELEAAFSRIRAHCEAHPEDDFFNASLALLKSLGTATGTKGK
jgi:hypothetical protein